MLTDPGGVKGGSAYSENQVSFLDHSPYRRTFGIPFSSELATKAYMGVILIIPLCSKAVVRKYRWNLDKLRRFHTVAGEHWWGNVRQGWEEGKVGSRWGQRPGLDSLPALPCSSREFQNSKFEYEYHKGIFVGEDDKTHIFRHLLTWCLTIYYLDISHLYSFLSSWILALGGVVGLVYICLSYEHLPRIMTENSWAVNDNFVLMNL